MNTTKTLKELSENVRIINQQGEARLDWSKRDDWQQQANDWRITLVYQGRRFSLDFWQGTGIKEEPTAEGVLDCLLSDAQAGNESFEGWCSNFGYDTDSRKAEKTYKACIKTAKRLRKLLGSDYETFAEAERS